MRSQHLLRAARGVSESGGHTRAQHRHLAFAGTADEGFLALTDDNKDVHPEKVAEASTGRFTHPQEVADLVLLLASGWAATSPAPTSSPTAGWSRPCDPLGRRTTAATPDATSRNPRGVVLVDEAPIVSLPSRPGQPRTPGVSSQASPAPLALVHHQVGTGWSWPPLGLGGGVPGWGPW